MAGQRRVIAATSIAVTAALGVLWVADPGDRGPVSGRESVPNTEDVAFAVPRSDADMLLVSGEPSGPFVAAALPSHRPVSIDLALPIPIDEHADTVWARLLTEGRTPLELDGEVRGADRNLVRLEIPGGILEPGSYLIEVKTSEKTHWPLRRFALIVN